VVYPRIVSTDLTDVHYNIRRGGRVYFSAIDNTRMKGSEVDGYTSRTLQGLIPGRARMLYSFGDYTLDAEHYELRQAGRLVRLEPRVFNLLAYLVQHAGCLVTTEELKEQLWPKRQVVGESSLTNAVAQVRKTLANTGQVQRYIETVHHRGYRFVVPVTAQPPGVMAPLTPDPPTSPSASMPVPPTRAPG
jgi:DNA-binding winged helix-turn-helix (wHTH) protein